MGGSFTFGFDIKPMTIQQMKMEDSIKENKAKATKSNNSDSATASSKKKKKSQKTTTPRSNYGEEENNSKMRTI